jgi:acetoin utilization protein AcuB
MLIDKTMTIDVVTIHENEDVMRARAKMSSHGIRHLPVVDDDNRLVGIVTDRDIRSAMPFDMTETLAKGESSPVQDMVNLRVGDIMTAKPYTISATGTIQDALVLFMKKTVGAFPVVDDQKKVVGIISAQDLLKGFLQILGVSESGTLLGILAAEKESQMKKIVDLIAAATVPMGSMLVVKNWSEGYRAVFVYLFSQNITHLKKMLEEAGFEMINPMQWFLNQFVGTHSVV